VAAHWLIKSEPSAYSFGDLCLYYHSTEEKAVVGMARVSRVAHADPTAPGEDWASVEVEAVQPLANPVTLERIRADPALKGFPLVTRGRLSVAAVTPAQYARVLALSEKREAPRAAAPKRSPARRAAAPRRRAR